VCLGLFTSVGSQFTIFFVWRSNGAKGFEEELLVEKWWSCVSTVLSCVFSDVNENDRRHNERTLQWLSLRCMCSASSMRCTGERRKERDTIKYSIWNLPGMMLAYGQLLAAAGSLELIAESVRLNSSKANISIKMWGRPLYSRVVEIGSVELVEDLRLEQRR